MNLISKATIVAGVLLLASAAQSNAIEGLKISVPCPDVVLGWPSAAGETYIVQWRPTLDPSTNWVTLADYLPADSSTNWTTFVHSNQVQCASGASSNVGGGGGTAPPTPGLALRMDSQPQFSEPLAMPANGAGSAVPLCLYPPGFDLSAFIILDPSTGEWVSGAGYTRVQPTLSALQFDGPQPQDDGPGGGDPPATGFYRVARTGVHFFGITNGMELSGLVTIPIEYSVTSTDAIAGITFYGEGAPLIGASQIGNTMQWDTTQVPNGTYAISAELDFVSDPAVAGTPVTVTVNNVISFPNYFTHLYGGQMWIYAQTIPYAECQIDLYDQDNNYLGYFWDYTDGNGVISFIWDLKDGNGNTLDSTNFTGVFTVDTSSLTSMSRDPSVMGLPVPAEDLATDSPDFKALSPAQPFSEAATPNGPSPDGPGSTATATEHWVKEPPWSVGNSWAVACSPQAGPPYPYWTQQMMLGGPGGEDGGVNFPLADSGCTLSSGNNQYDQAFEINTTTDKTNFLSDLAKPNFRHCYFFGDGNATSFGSGRFGVTITLKDLKNTLGNTCSNAPDGKPLYAAGHPYRLVFIDACSSAKGNLCEGFGIPAFTVNTNYFWNPRLQSRAFVGYTKDITSSLGGGNWANRSMMLGGFFQDWLSYKPLWACVSNAVNGVHTPFAKMDPSVVIYGARDLTRDTDTTKP